MPLRPTPDALRERAFAVLGDRVVDARVLDLYAGTGAVALEALSRGAATAVLVEHHRGAGRIIRANLEALGVTASAARLLVQPVRLAVRDLARHGDHFDLVWADPPFERWRDGLEAVETVARTLLAPGGLLCLECPSDADVGGSAARLELVRDLSGGASRVAILAAQDTSSP